MSHEGVKLCSKKKFMGRVGVKLFSEKLFMGRAGVFLFMNENVYPLFQKSSEDRQRVICT